MTSPEKVFQHGTCRCAIFANTVNKNEKNYVIKKVNFAKRYKDGDEWKNSNSLDINEIPKMIAALQSAYMYLTQVDTEKKNFSSEFES